MDSIDIILNDSDIRYGIIKIAKCQKFFTNSIGGEIYVECNGQRVIANIPHSGYISKLTKLHRDNNAKAGTKVTISKVELSGIYKLEYNNSCTQNLPIEESLPCVIDCIKKMVEEDTWQFHANETNVRAEIIDPILKELRWTFPDNIYREAVCRFDCGESKRVDYALFKDNKFPIIIEAKAIEKQLNVGYKIRGEEKPSPYQQIVNYLNAKQFKGSLGVLTNGLEWWFIEGEKLKTFKLTNPNFVNVIKLLSFGTFNINSFWDDIENFEDDVVVSEELKLNNKFNVIYNKDASNNIVGKDPTNTYNAFLNQNIGRIEELDLKYLLKKEIVATIKELKRTNNKQFDNKFKLKGGTYYIIRDYSTFEKRMLIQQIIRLLDIDARIEIVED